MSGLRVIQGGKAEPPSPSPGVSFWAGAVAEAPTDPLTEDGFLRGMYALARQCGSTKEPFLVWKERVVHVDAKPSWRSA